MQGIKRKIVYVTLYEIIAIACTSAGLALLGGHGGAQAGVAAVGASAIAVVWNLVYNAAFESWEARQTVRGRGMLRRAAHAIGFEIGLVVFIVPLFAWWLKVSLWEAFLLDLGLIVFFLVYTYVFSLAFDRIFGLPASATAKPAGEQTAESAAGPTTVSASKPAAAAPDLCDAR